MQSTVLSLAHRPSETELTKIRVNYDTALKLLRQGHKASPGTYVLLVATTSEWAKQNMAAQIRALDPWTEFSFTRTVYSDPGDWAKVYRIWGRIES